MGPDAHSRARAFVYFTACGQVSQCSARTHARTHARSHARTPAHAFGGYSEKARERETDRQTDRKTYKDRDIFFDEVSYEFKFHWTNFTLPWHRLLKTFVDTFQTRCWLEKGKHGFKRNRCWVNMLVSVCRSCWRPRGV